MKNIVVILFLSLFIISCEKEPLMIGNYKTETPKEDTSNWQSNYSNSGTLPNWGGNTQNNELNGTNWVLIDVYNDYANTPKSDTVHFISNTNYTLGSDTTKFRYYLYTTMGNSSLTLNTFTPINGLTLSCTNFYAGAFVTCQVGGTIQLNLKDNFNNTNNLYTAIFKKL